MRRCIWPIEADDNDFSTYMKAIIHIGMEKSGSSTIQRWRTVNAKALARDDVVILDRTMPNQPDLALQRSASHMALYDFGAASSKAVFRVHHQDEIAHLPITREVLERDLRSMRGKGSTFFGTCEHLFMMYSEQIRGLASLLDQHFAAATYVLYVRDPIDWMVS